MSRSKCSHIAALLNNGGEMDPGLPDHTAKQRRAVPARSQRQREQIEVPCAVEPVRQVCCSCPVLLVGPIIRLSRGQRIGLRGSTALCFRRPGLACEHGQLEAAV